MRNVRPFFVLLLLTFPIMLAGGCDHPALGPFREDVRWIGHDPRYYNVDAAAQAEDGSLLVISHSYHDGDNDALRLTVEKTHILRFAPKQIKEWNQVAERLPPRHAWYDDVMILRPFQEEPWWRTWNSVDVKTEETCPPSLRTNTPLELIPLVYEPRGEGLELVRFLYKSRGHELPNDEEELRQLEAEYDRKQYDWRVGDGYTGGSPSMKYRVLYRHGDMNYWVMLPESVRADRTTPGGTVLQVLLRNDSKITSRFRKQ